MRFAFTRMRSFALVAASVFAAAMGGSGCGMLFWSDTDAYKGGHWQGESLFMEITLKHERKTPWNPLNQNVMSRNYRTHLIFHEFAGKTVKRSVELGPFRGWVPRHGLQLSGPRAGAPDEFLAVILVGESDSYGVGQKEVTIFRLKRVEGTAIQEGKAMNIRPKETIIAAVPSPDGAHVAVLTTKAGMQKKTGRMDVSMYRVTDAATLLNRVPVKWPGAPGAPNLAWARDSSRLFIQRTKDMLEIAPGQKSPRRAARFPGCMTATLGSTNISDGGKFFYRQDGRIRVRQEPGWIARNKIPMVTSLAKIGAGCP